MSNKNNSSFCIVLAKKIQAEINEGYQYLKNDHRGNKGDSTATYKMQQKLRHYANAATAVNLMEAGLLSEEVAELANAVIKKEVSRLWQH